MSDDLLAWAHPHLGFVLGRDGKGGSGINVEMLDGSNAILTARHVIIDSLLTGAMMVGRVGDKQTVLPRRIRIASRADVALILPQDSDSPKARVSYSEWSGQSANLQAGATVFAAGFPGVWKEIDQAKKAIPSMKALVYGTSLTDPPTRGGLIVSKIDEQERGLPTTFEGMSGGALFSQDRKLLGVMVNQVRRIGDGRAGELHAVPLDDLRELHTPFQSPISDYMGQKAWAPTIHLVHQRDSRLKAKMELNADMYWSQSTPDAEYGRIGRIQMIRFHGPAGETEYPINTESIFYPQDDTQEERVRALDEEVRFLLDRTGWGIDPAVPR